MCGVEKLLLTILADTIEGPLEDEPEEASSLLPRQGTSFRKTLVVLAILPEGSSRDITERLNELNGLLKAPGSVFRKDLLLSVSDISSYLTILSGKGLVEKVSNRRGVPGGSTWRLTPKAIELLEIED
jgi:DNA-binding MarR family transcriptional regulator